MNISGEKTLSLNPRIRGSPLGTNCRAIGDVSRSLCNSSFILSLASGLGQTAQKSDHMAAAVPLKTEFSVMAFLLPLIKSLLFSLFFSRRATEGSVKGVPF
ncbi:hypothetical protein [Streptomyces sp. NPDC001880]